MPSAVLGWVAWYSLSGGGEKEEMQEVRVKKAEKGECSHWSHLVGVPISAILATP